MRKTPEEIKRMNAEDAKRRKKEWKQYGGDWRTALHDMIENAVKAEAIDGYGNYTGINVKIETEKWYEEVSQMFENEMMHIINMDKNLREDFGEIVIDKGIETAIRAHKCAQFSALITSAIDGASLSAKKELCDSAIDFLIASNKNKAKVKINRFLKANILPKLSKKELSVLKKDLTAKALKGDIYRRSSVNYK